MSKQYDVWEFATCVMTGDADKCGKFLCKPSDYICKAARDARLVNKRYTITAKGAKKPQQKVALYILWDEGEIVGVYRASEIAKNCFAAESTVRGAARTGKVFCGRYKALNYQVFAEAWETACGRLRRSAAGSRC